MLSHFLKPWSLSRASNWRENGLIIETICTKDPTLRAYNLHLCFPLLLQSFHKPPPDLWEESNLSGEFGWALITGTAWPWRAWWPWAEKRVEYYLSVSITESYCDEQQEQPHLSLIIYSSLVVYSRQAFCVFCMEWRQGQLQEALENLSLLNTQHRVKCYGNTLSQGKRRVYLRLCNK